MLIRTLNMMDTKGKGRPYLTIRHLKQDDAFNRTWWSVLSIDKLVTWQHLLIKRTGVEGFVMLKVSNSEVTKSQRNRRRQRRLQIYPKKIYIQNLENKYKVVDLLVQKL